MVITRGGVAVILKSPIITKKEESKPYKSFESMEILCKINSACVRLIVIYRPPSCSTATFLDEFCSYMDSLVDSSGMLLVVRDINIHVDDPQDSYGVKFNDLLYRHNLQQHVKDATMRKVTPWIL